MKIELLLDFFGTHRTFFKSLPRDPARTREPDHPRWKISFQSLQLIPSGYVAASRKIELFQELFLHFAIRDGKAIVYIASHWGSGDGTGKACCKAAPPVKSLHAVLGHTTI